MNRALHPKADVDRLYVSRNDGGRGMKSVEECVRVEENGLSDYLKRTGAKVGGILDEFLKYKRRD